MNEAQLTAYALNQLSDAERGEVERHFADEAARQAIREEASIAQRLREARAAETLPEVSLPLRDAIEAALLPSGEGARRADKGVPQRVRRIHRPRAKFAALALAAMLLVCVGVIVTIPALDESVREAGRVAQVSDPNDPELIATRELKHIRRPYSKFAIPIDESWEPGVVTSQPGQPAAAPSSPTGFPSEPFPHFTNDLEVPLTQNSFSQAPMVNGGRASPPSSAASKDSNAFGQVHTRGFAGGVVLDESKTSLGLDTHNLAPEYRFNTEAYDAIVENPFLKVLDNPLSTFSIDVDTASYSNVRRFITSGQLPPPGAVRIEELVNYFTYDYPQPEGDRPFSVTTEVAACPWNISHRLVRIGLKGRDVPTEDRPASNLVFLLDVSGSMNERNKLPLVKQSMRMLVDQLTERDHVAIVVYAGASGLVLPSTSGNNHDTIIAALDRLEAGGSTNGASGLQLAYETAQQHFVRDGINRVILCTDGDFNVGVTSQDELVRLIEDKAKSGVFLSALGFGMGNYKDATLEKLADKGNGNYAYIDTPREARKVLVEQMSGTLLTIAKDVKIQVEFNPSRVGAYRLIGYENRILAAEDFNNDKKDAGEIGAGHTVTALYEVAPPGENVNLPTVDPLKYQTPKATTPSSTVMPSNTDELLTVKLRYKQPDGDVSQLIEQPVVDRGVPYAQASADFKFAASVAAFGMILRHSPSVGTTTLDAVAELALEGKGPDLQGHRAEFIDLVRQSRELHPK
jgi:Ca-activated chloride channel family protein